MKRISVVALMSLLSGLIIGGSSVWAQKVPVTLEEPGLPEVTEEAEIPVAPPGSVPCFDPSDPSLGYTIGVDDVLEISVLKPEPPFVNIVTVTPDGTINFPYIGNVTVKGRSIPQVQEDITLRLGNGYMRYPIVAVALKESNSRKFYVYGEVVKPGSYSMEDNMTILRAVSMAGGFSKFGSSGGVKVLRPRREGVGYEAIKVNMKAIMEGSTSDDIILKQGDIVVVSEGVF